MSKFIQIFEGHGPIQLGLESWPYNNICTIYDYYSRKIVENKALDIKKVVFHFLFEDVKKNPPPDNIINIFEIVDDAVIHAESHQDKLLVSMKSLKKCLDILQNEFSLEKDQLNYGLQKIKEENFDFKGYVKKQKNKSEGIFWRYRKNISYSWINEAGEEIPIFKQNVRIIDHSFYFSSVSKNNHVVKINRSGTKDYWLIDTKVKSVDYISYRASQEDPHGFYDLGKMYRDGYLVPQDFEKARIAFQKAAQLGYKKAIRDLEKF